MQYFTKWVTALRYLFLLVAVLQLAAGCSDMLAYAQDAAPAAKAPSILDIVMASLKAILPGAIGFLCGYLTKLITWGLSLTPTPWLALVTSFLGALSSSITAALEGFSVEAVQANAVVGAGAGAVGHVVLQSKPIEPARPATPVS